MTTLPQTIEELGLWLARASVRTDNELDRLRRQIEDLETVVAEVRDMLAEMDGTKM